MRGKVQPFSVTPMPRMESYGLPPNFDPATFIVAKAALDSKRRRVAWIIAFAALAAFAMAMCLVFGLSRGLKCTIVGGLVELTILNQVPRFLAIHIVKAEAWQLAYQKEAKAYAAALRDWHFCQTEAGEGYWRKLRGVALEKAIASFFNRRGCPALLTRATGDGGVDVILTVGEKTYWCQCKGHATPIPVSEVRRIAGATLKSKGEALPALFSSNGYTKPALVEATELGVLCLDARYLAEKATKSMVLAL